MNRWIIAIGILIVLGAGVVFGIQQMNTETDMTPQKLKVAASFYPLAEFARQVGGEFVDVQQIVPAGVEAHDFDPSARTVADINNADVFLFLGAGFDPWAEAIDDDLEDRGVLTLRLTRFFSLAQRNVAHNHTDEDETHSDHDHTEFSDTETLEQTAALDPHIWLDPVHAQELVEIIRDILQNADPDHADVFNDNAAAYNEQIAQINSDYVTALSSCAQNTIITSHQSFGYVGDRYEFSITPIAGLSPHEEPSAQDLARISEFAIEHDVTYILTEPLVSDKFADTIGQEVEAQLLTLHPIESLTTNEESDGVDYIALMRSNLDALTTALQCES